MQEVVKKAFEEFKKDTTDIEEAKGYKFIGAKVLLRFFYYDPPKQESSLIIGGEAAGALIGSAADLVKGKELGAKFQLFPIAKVLAVGTGLTGDYADLKPGDIVTVKDDIKGTHLNPEWIHWKENGGAEARPKIQNREPRQFIGNIEQWKSDVFVLDKFKESMDIKDAFTFLLPQMLILSKLEN